MDRAARPHRRCAAGVLLVIDELLSDFLLSIRRAHSKTWHAIDDIGYQVKAVEVVLYDHIERCGRRASCL
jgi:hypothetical protein